MVLYLVVSYDANETDVKQFESAEQFKYWIDVLTRNNVRHQIGFTHESRPKQLEFVF